MVVIRRLRPDVSGRRDDDLAIIEVQSEPAMKGDGIVIVVKSGV